MATCPTCGAPLAQEGAPCGACAARARLAAGQQPPSSPPLEMPPDPFSPAAPTPVWCPHCGGAVPAGSAFCPACQLELAAAPAVPSAAPQPYQATPHPQVTAYGPAPTGQPNTLLWVLGGIAAFLLLSFAGATTMWQMRAAEARAARRLAEEQQRSQGMQPWPGPPAPGGSQPGIPGPGMPLPRSPGADAAQKAQKEMQRMMEEQMRQLQQMQGPQMAPPGPPQAGSPPVAPPQTAQPGAGTPRRGLSTEALQYASGVFAGLFALAAVVVGVVWRGIVGRRR